MASYDDMTDNEYMRYVANRSATISRFNNYKKAVCKALKISEIDYCLIGNMIVDNFGMFYL